MSDRDASKVDFVFENDKSNKNIHLGYATSSELVDVFSIPTYGDTVCSTDSPEKIEK